ncbi:MAG: restriction endonuclease subunit S [Anaerovibrio sp.]
MTPQQLRNSILQMAIEGKLTRQLPEDGNASDLLKKIKAEKARLIKEKKIKKEKPLPEIREDEVPFEIPDNWIWTRLGIISSYAQPKVKIKPNDINGSTWSLDLEDIEKNTGKIVSKVYASERNIKGEKVIFSAGNILYSKLRPYLKKILIATDDGVTTPELVPFYVYGTECQRYFMWYLRSPYVDITINSVCYGTKMPRVGTDTMCNLVIPLPPLAEQKRIVARLEEILPLVDAYEKAYNELQELNKKFPVNLKNSLLQMAIEGKLVEQRPEDGNASDLLKKIKAEKAKLIKEKKIKKEKPLPPITEDEIPFEVPESWRWVRLSDIYNFIDYRGKTPNKISSGVVLITASNIRKGYLDFSKKDYISVEEYNTRLNRGITQKGDLLFTTEAPMGNVCVNTVETVSCGQRVITFQQYDKSSIVNCLYNYFILSPFFQAQINKKATGTTAKGIKAAILKLLLIPLPPLGEQKRIVDKLAQLLPLCDELMKHG